MNTTTYGLDIAKRVFHLYWVEAETGEIGSRRFGKQALIEFLSQRKPGQVALEACGSAHWWARRIASLGHEVKLLHAKFVRPFVQTNKTDAADAHAIWTAAQQPAMRTVEPKTEDQQAVLSLHRMRALLVKMRTMQVNQLRGLLYEYGTHFKTGRRAGLAEIRQHLDQIEQVVPGCLFGPMRDQLSRIDDLDKQIAGLERQLTDCQKRQVDCQTVAAIPGIGMLTATALVATVGDARAFKSGRELAAFLGLVPRQTGTGGKVRLGGISKRGDVYLRTLLIHGARTVLFRSKEKGIWCDRLRQRRPTNVAAVAIANKMVRTAWALLVHGTAFEKNHVSVKPA